MKREVGISGGEGLATGVIEQDRELLIGVQRLAVAFSGG
jgi:hypothetical protein